MSSFAKMFVAALVAEGTASSLMQYGPIDHLFKASEVPLFAFVKQHTIKHGKIPAADTIYQETGVELGTVPEPSDYYLDLLRKRHVELRLKKVMEEATAALHPANKDAQKALEIIVGASMELVMQSFGQQIVDFRDCYDTVMAEYAAKWNKEVTGALMLGWPSFDEMSGGMGKGDLVSFVGRPQKGKTWQMLYSALHGWETENQSRLFVSMEMSIPAIQQRLAALYTHSDAGKLKHAAFGTVGLAKFKSSLSKVKSMQAPFWLLDGNLAATVEDIHAIARQLKVDGIFIDGAYLVKHPTERDRYRRVAENADLIKQELCPLAPTVASWQFAKTAAKKNKQKGEKAELEDIGYTDAIAQVSSIVLALLEDTSVENELRKLIDILKGRNGETGQFVTNWNFKTMSFSEIEETSLEELQYV